MAIYPEAQYTQDLNLSALPRFADRLRTRLEFPKPELFDVDTWLKYIPYKGPNNRIAIIVGPMKRSKGGG